jgi:excisionase family DNA binding protein
MPIEAPLVDAVAPSADESIMARESGRRLAALLQTEKTPAEEGAVRLSIGGGEEVALPAAAVRLLARLLTEMGEGHAVTLLPLDAELSSQGAADILNVSRPFMVGLLDQGKIPSRKVGTHRRVLLRDVLHYKRRDDERRHATLDELTAQAQELNMGY